MKSSKSRRVAGVALSLAALSMFIPQVGVHAAKPRPEASWHHSGIVVTLRAQPPKS